MYTLTCMPYTDVSNNAKWNDSDFPAGRPNPVYAELAAALKTDGLTLSFITLGQDIAKKLNYGYTDFMSYSIDFRRRILSIKKHEGLSICRYRCKTGPPADVNLTHSG